ncbi:hypothetical protein M8Z33_42015 [Streptomyces sp. ZAF1911]|uniref:hypothetical protein n=1 Tax=Streptomyces sp. ZAF1911 TaxID=2944129 RepID=UPI00237B439A|nr:hypothetical protein [Streptomyces sp. ZAF1911]MDD9383115.1 hypothetical protein [Streptomyces sp. ZAF1911]
MPHFHFPDDLIALKQDQIRIYRRLALQPALDTSGLRRELIRLSCLISAHPYWEQRGWSTAGQVELHQAAEAGLDTMREPALRARSS